MQLCFWNGSRISLIHWVTSPLRVILDDEKGSDLFYDVSSCQRGEIFNHSQRFIFCFYIFVCRSAGELHRVSTPLFFKLLFAKGPFPLYRMFLVPGLSHRVSSIVQHWKAFCQTARHFEFHGQGTVQSLPAGPVDLQ